MIVLTVALLLLTFAAMLWSEVTYSDVMLIKAQNGNIEAQFNLALCYQTGEGISKDVGEAYKWYCRAADQGHIEAKFIIQTLFKADDGM